MKNLEINEYYKTNYNFELFVLYTYRHIREI